HARYPFRRSSRPPADVHARGFRVPSPEKGISAAGHSRILAVASANAGRRATVRSIPVGTRSPDAEELRGAPLPSTRRRMRFTTESLRPPYARRLIILPAPITNQQPATTHNARSQLRRASPRSPFPLLAPAQPGELPASGAQAPPARSAPARR